MNKIHRKLQVLIILFSAGFSSFAKADEGAVPSPLVNQIAGILAAQFGNIENISFEASMETTFRDPEMSDKKMLETLKYTASGEQYKYVASQDSGGVGSDNTFTVAYDGESAYFLEALGGHMAITGSSRPGDLALYGRQGLFEPFAFFLPLRTPPQSQEKSGQLVELPSLADFKDSSKWVALAKGWKLTEVKFRDQDVICITLPGGMVTSTRNQSTFRVFLDKSRGYFPMAYERLADDGSFRYLYEVKEYATMDVAGQSFYYPKVASRSKYYGNDKEPWLTTVIKVENLSVNGSFDDDFAIDPTQATLIHDVNSGTYIQVPR